MIATMLALAACLSACGEQGAAQPAARPGPARLSVATFLRMRTCHGVLPRAHPVRLALFVDGGGPHRRLRVTTNASGRATVTLSSGRYEVMPIRRSLGNIASFHFDGKPVSGRAGARIIRIPQGGRHRLVVDLSVRPVECNGLGETG